MKWHIEKRKLSELKDHPKNPRILSKKDAKNLEISIKKFGLIDKPVITQDNLIIGGHQRKKILQSLNINEIDCWVPESPLAEKDIDELNIRLNKNTGEWDFDILANGWEIENLLEWGFDESELSIDVDSIINEDLEETELMVPNKDEEAMTNPGDIYDLVCGNLTHRIGCGDSTDPDFVKKLLNGAEPILMVTDPPYGVEYDPSWRDIAGKGTKAIGKVQNDDKINWSLAWHLFKGNIAYIWHAGKYCAEVQKSLEEADFEIISQIIWAKQHFAISRGDYHWQHEPCWYAVRKGFHHNWQGSRKESTLWEIPNLNAFGKTADTNDPRTSHSTQKPIQCMEKPILNNSQKEDIVYDPFLGSGTTLIACQKNGRSCYGADISPAYCDIIVERWINFVKNKNLPFYYTVNGVKQED